MQKFRFYTHAGFFHADEVTAYAICRMAGMVFDRDTGLHRLTDLNNIPEDGIVADIGRQHKPVEMKFDHHQGFIQRGGTGVPYATAGLMWAEYGKQAIERLLWGFDSEPILARVDETLIQGIDAHDADNAYSVTATCSAGDVRPVTISHIVASLNGDDVSDHEEQMRRFIRAADIVQSVLKSHIQSAAKYMDAKQRFSEVAEVDGKVIALPEHLPWREIIHDLHPEALFVITPSNHPGNPFSLIAVSVTPESRELKQPIERPDWFKGFIHQGKWIAGCESVEQAKKLAAENL